MKTTDDTDDTESEGKDREAGFGEAAGSGWISRSDPPSEDGWYLGNFAGAVRCIGYDNGTWDFWGTPSDQIAEDLTDWLPIPSLPNGGDHLADEPKRGKA